MYLALYRKWRPKTFNDVVGQEHITLTLQNEIVQNRLAHAYLFTGPRGTGKTTCSKILSMAVNCDNPINGNPCMECENCKGIDAGSVLDVVEIDAASNNGVDNIRELRDEASYTPSQCKYRVYIIDEAHMLSTGAFNALLKIMEEPPSHVIFILATTEAHKVPATILSRCQRFDFHRIKSDCIKNRLLDIAKAETAFTLDDDASELIARLADGGMRDALSLLDQCVASCENLADTVSVTLDVVVQSAGIVSQDYLFEICENILAENSSNSILLIDKLYSMSKDLQSLCEELVEYFRNILLVKTLKDASALVLVLPNEMEKIKELSGKFLQSQLLYFISELQNCMLLMGKSIDRRLCFELCVIRLCTPSLSTSNDAILARIDSLEQKLKSGMITPCKAVNTAPQVVQASTAPQAPIEVPQQNFTPTMQEPINTAPVAEQPLIIEQPQQSEFVLLDNWVEILEDIKVSDSPLWGALHGSQAFVNNGFLYIKSPLEFISGMLKQEGNANKLMLAVYKKTGQKYKLRIMGKAPVQNVQTNNSLDDILKKAQELGVEVNEHE